MAVRNRLREIRHQLCIDTKQEMADKLGITRSMLSDYERQKVQPNIETLLKISAILRKMYSQKPCSPWGT